MPTTRAQVEAVLVQRLGRWLNFVNLDGTTIDGTNPSLNDPIGKALRDLSINVTDITTVADADLLTLADTDRYKLLDIAELRCLETIEGNLDEVTERQGTDEQDWNGFLIRLRAKIEHKRQKLEDEYGIGLGALVQGTITLAYIEPEPNSTADDD